MSLLRRVTREHRDVTYQDVWGKGIDWPGGLTTLAGERVGADVALGLPAVWRCVSLLADTVSAMPMHAYRDVSGVQKPMGSPPTLIVRPSLVLSRREWVQQAMVSMLLWGNAYGLILERDSLGVPRTVEWLDPASVRVEASSSLRPPSYSVNAQPLPDGDVVHARALLKPGAFEGLSPLDVHKETIGLGLAVRKFGSQWFGNGAHPSGVLETEHEVTEEQAKVIKSKFKRAAKGRDVVALGKGAKFRQVQVGPNESQFIETQQNIAAHVAQAFGVPAEMIGAAVSGQSVTYANREQQSIDFLTYGVQPWLVRLEDLITGLLPRPQYVKFNPGSLLRTDLKTRYEAHAIALKSHFLTIDEVRALEERPPLGNGEQFPPNGSAARVDDTPADRGLSAADVERADELAALRGEVERLRRGRRLRVIRDADGFAQQVVEEAQ